MNKFSDYIQEEITRLEKIEEQLTKTIKNLEEQSKNLENPNREEILQKLESKKNELEKFRQRYHL